MTEADVETESHSNRLKLAVEQVIELRANILPLFEEAVTVMRSDTLLSGELLGKLVEGLALLTAKQADCWSLSGQPMITDGVTLTDLLKWREQLDEQTNASRLAAKAKRIIEQITALVCSDDDIVEEIQEFQLKASKLLAEDVQDEERVTAAEKYEWVIKLLGQSQDEENVQELYRAVRKEFGFVVKYALENSLLRVDVAMASVELLADESTGHEQASREPEVDEKTVSEHLDQSDFSPENSADLSIFPSSNPPYGVDLNAYRLEWLKYKQLTRFSASKFEEDLRQPPSNRRLATFLLTYIRNYDVLVESWMDQENPDVAETEEKTDDSASEELRFLIMRKLAQKGYLNTFTVTSGEECDTFYTLSEAGAEAFRKETSRRFIQSHSKLKMFFRTEASDSFIPREGDDADQTIITAFRLRAMNRVITSLSRQLSQPISMTESTVLYPFTHRKLRYHNNLRLLLIPAILHPMNIIAETEHIQAIAATYEAIVPLVVAASAEEGCYWAELLSNEERPAYFVLAGDKPFIGDASGQDSFALIFDLESENVLSVPNTDSVVEQDKVVYSACEEDYKTGEKVTEREQFRIVETATSESASTIAEPETLELPVEEAQLEPELQSGIVTSISISDRKMMLESAMQFLAEDRKAEGLMLIHAASEQDEELSVLRSKVSHALGDPMRPTVDLITLLDQPVTLPFRDCDALDDYLNAALSLRLFFEPDNANDYRLSLRWKQMVSNVSSTVLEQYPIIKRVAGFFHNFIDRHHVGIKICASNAIRDELGIKRGLEMSRKHIVDTLENVFPRNVKANIGFAKAHALVQDLYSTNGLLTGFLRNAFTIELVELRRFCQAFTDVDLSAEHLSFDLKPLDAKLEEFLDSHWEEMSFKAKFGSTEPLKGIERNRQRSRLREAIQPLLECYVYRNASERLGSMTIKPETVHKARTEACMLLEDALCQLQDREETDEKAGRYCLLKTVEQLISILGDETIEIDPFYAPLLLNRDMELDEEYRPIMDDWMQGIPSVSGYRMWERILQNAQKPHLSWHEAAMQALRRYDMGQYDLIRRLPAALSADVEWPDEETVRETREQAKAVAIKYKMDFMTEVESAQNYGQIGSKDEMYGYFRLADFAGKHVMETTQNIGFYKRLLDACRDQIMRGSDERMQATRDSLEALKRDILRDPDRNADESDEEVLADWPILDKISRMLEMRNMTVAEDYIQLADNGRGDRNTPSMRLADKDLLSHFFNQYQLYFQACNANKRDDLFRTYEQHVKHRLYPGQSNRNTASADRFMRTWYKPASISEFMEQLFYPKIRKVERSPGKDAEYYIYPSPRDAKLGQYQHPFADFGTFAERRGVRVLLLAGVRTADNLLDEVAQYGAAHGAATIVVLDYALPLADRRQLAKSIKLRTMPETIVIVDRVMALFLAGYNQIERGDIMLKIALPFSKVQPYIPVGSIPPEMFIGRTDELDKIQSPNGPVFVYGGRQLGKTALLRESRNREHDPDKDRYALFIDLKQADCDKALQRISDELVTENILTQSYPSWEELKTALRARLGSKERPIRKLMLLLDEADVFILSCEKVNNRPLEILKELKDLFHDRFKFVLAGLRDVVRFNKQRLGGNSVLAHLGHMTIRPLEYLEARELLQRPLHYLGFRIQDQDEHLISLILAKTNYYPGLIHFYCQKLLETISENYRRGAFSENTTPPYILDERYLKSLLGSNDFLEEIENKFRITLQLDADDLYDILAKAMAYHYYSEGIGKGASVQDIKLICSEFGIEKINRLSEENVRALLEEMDELNIFRKEARNSGKYVFNRYSFFQMLGSYDSVFDQLINYGS